MIKSINQEESKKVKILTGGKFPEVVAPGSGSIPKDKALSSKETMEEVSIISSFNSSEKNKSSSANDDFLKRFISSVFALFIISAFGFGIIIFPGLKLEKENSQNMQTILFVGGFLGNLFCTFFRSEICKSFATGAFFCITSLIIAILFDLEHGRLISIVGDDSSFIKHNTLNILSFSSLLYGIGIGYYLKLTGVYISSIAPESCKFLLLTLIGGIGIVGGLTVSILTKFYLGLEVLLITGLAVNLIGGIFFLSPYSEKLKNTGAISYGKLKKITEFGRSSILVVFASHLIGTFSGINYMIENTNVIFRNDQGFSPFKFLFNQFFSFFFTFYSSKFALFVGKKFTMLICLLGVFFCNTTFYYGLKEVASDKLSVPFYIPYVGYAFYAFFNLGVGPLPHAFTFDLFPIKFCQEAAFISSVSYWTGSIISVFMGKSDKSYFIFNICILLYGLLVLILLPETNNRKPNFIFSEDD